jgi:hypothetical protein
MQQICGSKISSYRNISKKLQRDPQGQEILWECQRYARKELSCVTHHLAILIYEADILTWTKGNIKRVQA